MTNLPSFSLVEKGIYFLQTAYMLSTSSKYLLGALNSKISALYLSMTAADLGRGAKRWIKQYVEKLPIPLPSSANSAIVSEIEVLVDEIISKKREGNNSDTTELEGRVDELVFDLYGLTQEERDLIMNYEL